MGNEFSSTASDSDDTSVQEDLLESKKLKKGIDGSYSEFLSSAGRTIGNATGIVCGSLSDTFEEGEEESKKEIKTKYSNGRNRSSSPSISSRSRSRRHYQSKDHVSVSEDGELSPDGFLPTEDDESLQTNPMSALFARALLSEVTDNPGSMTPAEMAQREKKLIKAQERAKHASKEGIRPIGRQGSSSRVNLVSRTIPPSLMSENRAQVRGSMDTPAQGKHRITLGLSLSRRHATLGHPETVTRQTSFDFNELQDRDYKYVSSTDSCGWKAGGGESGATMAVPSDNENGESDQLNSYTNDKSSQQPMHKVAAPDTVHIPIIHIDCDSTTAVDNVIASIARGEVFIPHMSVLPEALGVNGVSPPDLVVRFGCERNDDIPPEQWPNWCLEFMHNQLYEYFAPLGAQWMKRPFQITLAKKVRWKTVKHMNKFFTQSEQVINAWREKGSQYLDPQLSYIEGGATPEEVARPHGIYLMRNGRPTNYFPPNFEPPYTTKMTRSLLSNVISKSWDKKRRDWTSEPLTRSVSASLLFSTMCGCNDNQGFVAREATNHYSPGNNIIGKDFFGANQVGEYGEDLALRPTQHHKHLSNATVLNDDTQNKIIDGTTTKSPQDGSRKISPSRTRTSSKRSQPNNAEDYYMEHKTTSHLHNNDIFHHDHITKNVSENDNISLTDSDVKPMIDTLGQSSVDDALRSMQKEPLNQKRRQMPIERTKDTLSIENRDHAKVITEDSESSSAIDTNKISTEKLESRAVVENTTGIVNVNFEDDMVQSMAASEHTGGSSIGQSLGIISVGESQTTVQIMNGSSTKFIELERERRKQREVEREKERRKMDQLEMAIQEQMKLHKEKIGDLYEEKASIQEDYSSKEILSTNKSKSSSKKKKKEKKKKDKKDKKEKWKNRNSNNLMSQEMAEAFCEDVDQQVHSLVSNEPESKKKTNVMISEKENTVKKHSGMTENHLSTPPTRDSSFLPLNLSNDHTVSHHTQSNTTSSPLRNTAYEISSQASMDYSLDTASLLGDGSLIGGQFAGDGSVITLGTNASENRSLLSCVTRSTIHDPHKQNRPATGKNGNDEDDISLSLMASSSSGLELIPTDEELFAVGWAKAMDPSSGSYYFFTLDRSTIVWDNPLEQVQNK